MLCKAFFTTVLISVVINELVSADDHLQTFDTIDTTLSSNHEPEPNYIKGVKSVRGRKRPPSFPGGCNRQPDSPTNGAIRCSIDSGCIVNCAHGYKFPNGLTQLAITCSDGQWYIPGTDWTSIPHCEPICLPECVNNGICIGPHKCNCSDQFTGPQCQFENKPCLNYPAVVLNSNKQCNSMSCTIFCKKNFTFPDGTSVTNLICKNGNWELTRKDWVSIPNCEPVCNPPCQNGGYCLPSNVCQCPQAFRGPQCQYSTDACNGKKLGFNGGFSCSEAGDIYTCSINCPAGVEFEFTPASEYTCNYEMGTFTPQPIPQCKYNENRNVVTLGTIYNSYFTQINQSWVYEDVHSINTNQSTLIQTNHDDTGVLGNYENAMTSNKMIYNPLESNMFFIQENKPVPETCFTWSGVHYKTFDDAIFSFNSKCSYILIQEAQNRLLTVTVENSQGCKYNDCSRIINIFIQDKQYTLLRTETGIPEFRTPKKLLPIPAQLSALRVEMSAQFIVVSLDSLGIQLKWDGALMVQIEALENMWNNTVGLCGNMNGNKRDDFTNKDGVYTKSIDIFATSWKADSLKGICDELPDISHSCKSDPILTREAIQFCSSLLSHSKFKLCASTVSISELHVACLWDYCSCTEADKKKCACETMNVYIRQCAHKKMVIPSGWRNSDTCPMSCTGGRMYMPCGPKMESSCWTGVEQEREMQNCEEGCFCPVGTVIHAGKCIYPEECPCRLRGKLFEPGKTVQKTCNTCTCLSGKWICTQAKCSARCAVIGDPHYTTFDGRHYDFMGKCRYYLMKGENYTIEGENVPCSGAISENMGLIPPNAPSCTKTVTINYNHISLKLKQHKQVLIDGEDLKKFPTIINGIKIRVASSIFLIVELPNGLDVWWDGISRIYINAPSNFHGKTNGLCGTFSENQKDDFVTPEGDIENTAIAFANKWKSEEHCPNVPEMEQDHPCDLQPQKKATAKQYCSYLLSDIFAGCHWHVDPDTFYKDCLFDMCSCEVDFQSCLCPTLAAYAKDCVTFGIELLWRESVEECRIHCPGNQVYQICGNSCTRSCEDISTLKDCRRQCVEGCNCPEGQSLNENGECIQIGQCPCVYEGREFQAGHKEIRPGNKAQDICTCAGGIWNCREATQEEITAYPAVKDLQISCLASKHQIVVDCAPVEPRTCHNMHKPVQKSIICKSSCVCQPGYVLNEPGGNCIKEQSCPCHHGGQSYREGSSIQNECNTCNCINGSWICTDRTCAGVCTAWGDSHYKTFDGKMYDFQGICDYVLAKGSLTEDDCFDISIQNVPCGTTGVACSKSITITIGMGQKKELIVLTRGKELPVNNFKRIAIRTAGLFVFIDVPDMGLSVQWDKGTRVYIRLESSWKGHTKGLCGDYNDNSEDDFKTPSGGISEVSTNLFGDSWKKHEFCPEPKDVRDTCEQRPERMLWAVQECGILKSSIFQPCHSEVEVENYLHNCIFDTCGCDTGSDCECLCTALAAYAQECNAKGIPIKWRSQDLCPIQCDHNCSFYSPCITTCPPESCNNLMTIKDKYRLCTQDICVEGCSLKSCPENEVYSNDNYTECVLKETCRVPCMDIDGIMYYEGETIMNDTCQICFCSRGKVLCQGEPCVTSTVASTVLLEEPQKCVDGWTPWINQDPAIKGRKIKDVEPLPLTLYLANIEGSAVCDKSQMVDIKCRSVKDHLTVKETGLDVECSLERGLYCESHSNLPCIDFEISVLCQCFLNTTVNGETLTTVTPTPEHEQCNTHNQPYKAHRTDCNLFYQCTSTLNGNEFVERSCGPSMFFNPQFQICDWPANVLKLRPECSMQQTTPSKSEWITETKSRYNNTTTSHLEKNIITTKICKDGEIWTNCAIDCDKTCHYYKYIMDKEQKCYGCISGCVSFDKPPCSPHKFSKDAMTCVDEADCTCSSHDGHLVMPNAVYKESECEICQCLNNYYTCDRSSCDSEFTEISTETPQSATTTQSATKVATSPSSLSWSDTSHIIVLPSTVSPPGPCMSNFVSLIEYFKDQVSYKSKESLSGTEKPVKIGKTGLWQPVYTTVDEWLDIIFPKPISVYGITIQGSETDNKFVTSYKVLYSEDSHRFSYILNNKRQPNIFSGPVDQYKPITQKFALPIEASIIRINPQTWHNGIAMKVELLGCQDLLFSTQPQHITVTPIGITEKAVVPVCDEPMGVDNGLISREQISASSSFTALLPNLRLSSPDVWHPKLNNPHQYIVIDFLEPRNITGIITKGGKGTWTTAYKVFYSNNNHQWNPVIDDNGVEREFIGNYDADTTKENYFNRPLNARYLKIQPFKWHKEIGLKLEILGCFLPYPSITTSTETVETTTITQKCNICEGLQSEEQINCYCEEPLWWNGNSCIEKHECPCIVGHILYNVGAMYMREDCQECTCTLSGISFCQPKKCEPCREPDMRPVINELCNCICKPCTADTRLCPTSGICIDTNAWCDGVQNCPDDETDCEEPGTTSYVTPIHIKATTEEPLLITPEKCPEPVCPRGYKIILKTSSKTQYSTKDHMNGGTKTAHQSQSRRKELKWSTEYPTMYAEDVEFGNETKCAQFTCIPIKPPPTLDKIVPQTCPEVFCPQNYTLVYEQMSMYKLNKCPKYSCIPPAPIEVICNVTGRTLNTFDKLNYQYDACNHILTRDMYSNKWYITYEKLCDSYNEKCIRALAVTLDNNVIVLYPDMHVDINQYSFTPNQIARLGDKNTSFRISTIGDSTYFLSKYYGFWVILDRNSNVKIGISTKWVRRVDGLCGYFDGNSMNDRQLPNGTQAESTIEFGNSWMLMGVPECDVQVCPHYLHADSWKISNAVKDYSLSECATVIDTEKFVSEWFEQTCNCLFNNHTYNECRCQLLTTYVTECKAGNTNIDLSTWRTIHDCPPTCISPFIHKDCFRNKCETSCSNLQQIDACPVMPGICFSGCFCPEGTVRNGEECIPPVQCKDCVCEVLGNSKFISFDKKNVKFDGNCTYVLSRDIIENKNETTLHTYQVLVSNRICDTGICTEEITVLYQDHEIKIREAEYDKNFEVQLDGWNVNKFPFNTPWLNLEQIPSEKLRLLITPIQLEIITYQSKFAFTVSIPSHTFGGNMEGLCGNCNEDPEDDLKQQNGKITDDTVSFGTSWLVPEFLAEVDLNTSACVLSNQNKCILPPADQDPCTKLLSGLEFEICHNLVDPMPYLMACQDSLCSNEDYCNSFEAYSRKCKEMGLCLNWRTSTLCPYTCPPHLIYNPCGSSCKKNCDNVYRVKDAACTKNLEEGCFCPQNFVLHNDSCIEEEKCLLCDAEGHVDGDIWFPDICTSCTCTNSTVSCEKSICPAVETICEVNMIPIVVNGTEEDCCTKYLCVPEVVNTTISRCTEDHKIPECGYGQVIKLFIDPDGCTKYMCECVPPSECPIFDEVALEVEELQSGFIRVVNMSGCCPRYMTICSPQTCPSTPICPKYYELNVTEDSNTCCTTYNCIPPNDLCLYTMESLNETDIIESVTTKKIGEQWMDGNCITCICEPSEGGPKSTCLKTNCPNAEDNSDISDYVVEEIVLQDKCCPQYERQACRHGERIYNIGEEWQPNIEDSCTLMECIKDVDRIRKRLKMQECVTTCELGFEYQPSDNKSINCCGKCIPVACVVDNQMKNIGEEWFSIDYCTKYSCESNNGSIYVELKTEICPEIHPWEEMEIEVEKQYISGQCCPVFIKTGCIYNGNVYKPGERWRSIDDMCVTEICALQNNVTKYKELEVCNKDCPTGWVYEEQEGECCGKCRQMHCVFGDMMYEPGVSWSSPDNCTLYSCMDHGEQLSITKSFGICPDITDCPVNSVYIQDCCQMCNLTSYNKKIDACAADVLDAQNTIGIFNFKHRIYGFCKNMNPIEGITECRGSCESTSYFDTEEWSQVVNCQCCQPMEYKGVIVDLTCENYRTIKKQVAVPVSCTCSSCTSNDGNHKGTKGGVKG